MYYADVLPSKGITGSYDSFGITKRDIIERFALQIPFGRTTNTSPPGFRVVYNWIYD
jgi:hypothetical protein